MNVPNMLLNMLLKKGAKATTDDVEFEIEVPKLDENNNQLVTKIKIKCSAVTIEVEKGG